MQVAKELRCNKVQELLNDLSVKFPEIHLDRDTLCMVQLHLEDGSHDLVFENYADGTVAIAHYVIEESTGDIVSYPKAIFLVTTDGYIPLIAGQGTYSVEPATISRDGVIMFDIIAYVDTVMQLNEWADNLRQRGFIENGEVIVHADTLELTDQKAVRNAEA